MASHDRAFLDATVTRVWELRDRRLIAFRGNYSAYHRQRAERDERAAKEAVTHAEQIARERELVQRYRSHRKFSKMHEHEARLEKLQEDHRAESACVAPARAAGPGARRRCPGRSGEIVVRVDEVVVGYLPGRGAHDVDGRPASEQTVVARSRRPARRADRDRRSQRRRQDNAAAHDRRGAAAARRRPSRSATTRSWGTSPSFAAARSPGRPSSRR